MTYNVFSGTLNPTHFTSLHVWVDDSGGPKEPYIVWVYRCSRGERQF